MTNLTTLALVAIFVGSVTAPSTITGLVYHKMAPGKDDPKSGSDWYKCDDQKSECSAVTKCKEGQRCRLETCLCEACATTGESCDKKMCCGMLDCSANPKRKAHKKGNNLCYAEGTGMTSAVGQVGTPASSVVGGLTG